jgi:hypothetical protein
MMFGAMAICIALCGVLHAQQTNSGDQRLRGTWLVKVYPQGLTAPLLGTDLNQFSCDGTEIAPTSLGDLGLPPGVTGDSAGTGTGTYESIGKGKYRFTFYRLITANGVLSAYQRISGTITLYASGNKSIDHARTDFFDLNWNILFTAQTDAYGTRLPTPEDADSSHCE